MLLCVFFLQFYLAELLSINMIRPDFMTIFILYTAIKFGRFYGVIAGFIWVYLQIWQVWAPISDYRL